MKPKISIVLPCFNEGPTFEDSVSKIIRELSKLKTGWEIVFVEDKSTDETAAKVLEFVKSIKTARAIFHNRNMGRGKAVKDGINAARGKICGFLDVDLEVSESYIPLFADEIKNGADMAVGRRFYEGGFINSLPRVLASKVYAHIVKFLIGVPIDDTEAGYKFFNREKILPVLKRTRDNHWFFDTEICARAHLAGLSITQVPVLFIRRPEKKSTVRLLPDTFKYFLAILKYRLNG